MAIIKCKMCGGDLVLIPDSTVCECDSCGVRQTVPTADNEKKLGLFARANRLRAGCEFDKAAGVFESIVAEFPEEAEAYWGLVLCKYGIEYVDDPGTGKKIPTCHRSSFESVLDDSNVELTLEYADVVARRVYREEARQIEELRKGIIEVSAKEEPYDIFICYKETGLDGQRTMDSVLAQDIYKELTREGYRVFFSRITLEDKLGVEYEPYIFAALNSAKIMLAVGTDYDHFDAVWVKNEWSRFLKLMASDHTKHLIPCYKGIDAYDMPKEFTKLQAQDLGKVGATQDLLRGVEKILPRQKESTTVIQKETIVTAGSNPTMESYLKRAFMFLEDGDWTSANEYCEKVLDTAPECGKAYLGKLMVDLNAYTVDDLKYCDDTFDDNTNYKKILRYGDKETKDQVTDAIKEIVMRKETATLEVTYVCALDKMHGALKEEEYKAAANMFYSIRSFRDSAELAAECIKKAERLVEESIRRREREEIIRRKAEEEDRIAREKAKLELQPIRQGIQPVQGLLTAGQCTTVGIYPDGEIIETTYMGKNRYNTYYGQCGAAKWRNIVAVSLGYRHAVGLQSDGTLVAVGQNYFGQCGIYHMRDMVSVCAGENYTVGVKASGEVVVMGEDTSLTREIAGWSNIVAISAGLHQAIGLKTNGYVESVGVNCRSDQIHLSKWRNIVAVGAGDKHVVGLRDDGAVMAAGENNNRQCNVSSWRNIVAIAACGDITVGLKSDGTVIAVGIDESTHRELANWKSMVAISAGKSHIVGLKSDGVVLAAGNKWDGACDVQGWKLFEDMDNLEQEQRLARGLCQHCGGVFKGLFSKKCSVCGQPKDY